MGAKIQNPATRFLCLRHPDPRSGPPDDGFYIEPVPLIQYGTLSIMWIGAIISTLLRFLTQLLQHAEPILPVLGDSTSFIEGDFLGSCGSRLTEKRGSKPPD